MNHLKLNNRIQNRYRPRAASATNTLTRLAPSRDWQLEGLKARLLQEAVVLNGDPQLNTPLQRAANEAASLVWGTPYPLLLFPALFEEKAGKAARQAARQIKIRQRSLALLDSV
jgi:hypothetical protein